MKVSVIVPSYRRPEYLKRCINALLGQSYPPSEIIVVLRRHDSESESVVDALRKSQVKKVWVDKPGLLIALNKGLEEASGDIIAFTDDDAEPLTNWIEKIVNNFNADPRIGAVGGRDIIVVDGKEIKGKVRKIGKLQWFGRAVGYHHLELEPPRKIEVDVLKGVNMAFRRNIIKDYRFDENMNNISSVANEFDVCFYLKKRGAKIIYDPKVKVKHYPAPRQLGVRGREESNVYEYSRNYTYVMLKHLPWWRKGIFLLYFFLVGQRASYGFFLFLYDVLRGKKPVWRMLKVSLKGKSDGVKVWWKKSLRK